MTDQLRPTGETAIVIVPPPDVCGFAGHYRRLYMPDTRHHIEPHITIVVPFVPYDELPKVEQRLREALATCEPRPVSLRGFATFLEEGVLYLRTADPERVLSIYRAIVAEFPQYPAYGGKFGDNLVPHLTVGTFSDPEELKRAYEQLSLQRLFIPFDVEQVTVKYKMSNDIWETWAELPLGG